MAILSALKVTDVQDLRTEATQFQTHADELHTVTERMLELVESTSGIWHGLAQNKYATQFANLRDEMQVIYDMCVEYSEDLIKIAQNYETAETDNEATAQSLQADLNLRI